MNKSQSHRTAQGNSEGGTSNPLNLRGLRCLFFQPPRNDDVFPLRRFVPACLKTSNPLENFGLASEFQPMCQNGELALA